MKYAIGSVLGILLGIFGITWAFQGNDFFMYRVFAPKYEAARRQTFEESKAYNDGMAQQLAQARLDYARANKEQKQAIGSVILHQFAGYDRNRLDFADRAFLDQVQSEQIGGGSL